MLKLEHSDRYYMVVNDAVARAIDEGKFLRECYAIALPQIQNKLHKDTNSISSITHPEINFTG
jgi:hypothetical protein